MGARPARSARSIFVLGTLTVLGVLVVAPVSSRAGPATNLDEHDIGDASTAAKDASNAGPCPDTMVEVSGAYCAELDQHCVKELSKEAGGVERCGQFAKSGPCKSKTQPKKHFCIDKYEYPNKLGEKPVVMKTWTDAQDICKHLGKRLCTDSEWTLACEGNERLPYPYGRKRDAKACNIDKNLPEVDQKAVADPKRSAAEVARLYQAEPSGSRPGCFSPFGVFDMTGNVDEWVVNESGKPFKSGSKGGYWGPVRARCRPMTTAHGETFPFYQTGFRCCADPKKAD